MNVLYYMEPKFVIGGVCNVAHYLPKALAKKVSVTYFPYFTPKKSYIANLLALYTKFVKKEFDIIHFNTCPAWINGGFMLLELGRKLGSATVLNIHGIIPLEHEVEPAQGPIPYMALSNTLRACKTADRIVVNSEYMRTEVVAWYGINRDKIVVIPNGVNLRMFTRCSERLELDGDPSVLYVGSLSRGKGVDVLLQAVARLRSELPNMKLHLVGSGHMTDFQLLAKKKEIEKFVVFHGLASHSMVPRYYRSADICVFPSRLEGFGIVILEAMASGKSIVASNVGGIPEIISDGENGILVKPDDSDALAETILALLRNDTLRNRVSHNAMKTASKYSWDNIAEKYISLYAQLTKS